MPARRGQSKANLFQHAFMHFPKLCLGVLVIALLIGLNQIDWDANFPIKTVKIFGVNHSEEKEIESALSPLVTKGFFTVDVEHIRDRLRQMPWVSDISARRNWPNELDITIIERDAVASWNKNSLLSAEGELFSPKKTTYPQELAEFVGPDGKQIIMLKYFVNMNRIVQSLHAKISYLELTSYYTWKVKLDNGIVLKIEFDDALTRLRHFVKVYPKIIRDRVKDVEYIDLRYPNGMAVRWKRKV